MSFTAFATFFGAEAIAGTAGRVYERGLAGEKVDPLRVGVHHGSGALVFDAPLWRRGMLTLADFFRERYSPAVERRVVLVLLPGSILWAVAQIEARAASES